MRLVILIHLALLALASTNFTIITALTGEDHFQWQYYEYQFTNGFGEQYHSPYSAAVIFTYLLAYVVGLVGFCMAIAKGRRFVGGWGLILSVLGLVSFGVEASHWFTAQQESFLAFSPGAMLVLSLLVLMPGCTCKSHKAIEPTLSSQT